MPSSDNTGLLGSAMVPALGGTFGQMPQDGSPLLGGTSGTFGQSIPQGGSLLQNSQPTAMNTTGVNNTGAFMAGPAQIQNQGGNPWNVLFEPVNHDPFQQQAVPLASSGGMYRP